MDDRENRPMWSPFAKTYDPLQSGSIDGTDTIPHDRALVRAMEAKYVPPNKNVATPDAEKTLFVGRLDHKTTEENLKNEFSKYGTVTKCRVVKDIVTGFSRGYAFVQFKRREDAERARQDALRVVLDGREILVEWENGRTMPGWIPRRLGGGFGGKKESGQLRFGGRHRPFRKPIVIAPMKRDRSLNLDEEELKPFQEMDGQSVEEEESERRSSRTEYQGNYTKDLRSYRSSRSQFSRRNSSKPWERRNPEYSGGRGRSSKNQRERNEGEDRRWSGRSSKDSNEWDYSKRGERDRRVFGKSSRDQRDGEDPNEKEDRRYSSKSSQDRVRFEEQDDTHQRRSIKLEDNQVSEEGSRRSQDREYTDGWEESHEGRFGKTNKRSRRSRDREYPDEWEESHEGRSEKMKKRPRRSRDREYPNEWDDSSEKRVKKEGKQRRSSNDRNDMSDWEDTPERSDSDKKRTVSSKDREDDDLEDSPKRSKDKKRSKRSRDHSDTEEQDDGHAQKSKKKKKKSKKSSRDCSDSDGSYEKRKEKKKKKHKKSRD